jgi:hypothetical protein
MPNHFVSRVLAAAAFALCAPVWLQAAVLPSNFDLSVEAAVNDNATLHPQTGALYMFGVGGMFGSASALVFTNNSGRFYSVPGGSVITGELAVGVADSTSSALILDASRRFQLQMQFSTRGRTAGSGGPKLELKPEAYVNAGGNIDPDMWSYFDLTGASLVGEGDFDGITIALTQMPANSEYPFQFGNGASGRNVRASGSMWFDWVITTATNTLLGAAGRSGTGDVYLQANCGNDSSTASALQLPQCAASVPTPGTSLLLGAGLLALAYRRIRPASRGIACTSCPTRRGMGHCDQSCPQSA